MGSKTLNELPIIELNNENLTPGSSSRRSTCNLVRCALESYGCFIAVYKKVSSELHEKVFNLTKEIFELPVEIKVKNTSEYLGFGYGSNFAVMPLIEYLGITHGANLEATRDFSHLLWPGGNENFCETTFSYSKQLSELDHVVMRMVMESYGIEKYYEPLVESSFYLMRFIKYRAPKLNEINAGLHPHVDKTFLGVLGTNHVKGLEIETKDGRWINFQPSNSAFLVLAGEAFTAWSNGKVYAPLHRVTIDGTEERYTIGLFSFMRETLQVPEELVDEENPLQFKPFNNLEFLDFCANRLNVQRSIKDFCGI